MTYTGNIEESADILLITDTKGKQTKITPYNNWIIDTDIASLSFESDLSITSRGFQVIIKPVGKFFNLFKLFSRLRFRGGIDRNFNEFELSFLDRIHTRLYRNFQLANVLIRCEKLNVVGYNLRFLILWKVPAIMNTALGWLVRSR